MSEHEFEVRVMGEHELYCPNDDYCMLVHNRYNLRYCPLCGERLERGWL